MRRFRWPALILVVLGVFYGLMGFLVLPRILRSVLQQKLSEALHRSATVRELRVNPFRLSVDLRGVQIAERDGRTRFLSFGELHVNASLASVWKRGLVVDELRLSDPYVRLARGPDGTYNFSDLLKGDRSGGEGKKGGAARFALGNVRILRGALDFVDGARGEAHGLRDLTLALPFVSNFPAYVESYLQPALTCTADGRPFSLRGKSKAFAESLETWVEVRLSDIDLPKYVGYLPPDWKARLTSGRLDAKLGVWYVQRKQGGPSLTLAGTMDLKDAAVEDSARRTVASLPLASAAFGPIELFSRSARVTRIRLESPQINLVRTPAGTLNVLTLLPPKKAEEENPKPFSFRVDEFVVAGGKVDFADEGARFRTVLAPIEIALRSLSNAPGQKGQCSLSARTERGEGLALSGSLGLEPVDAAGQVRLEGLDLAKYVPYYRDKLRLEGAGRLGVETSFTVRRGGAERNELGLSGLKARLQGLRLRKPGDKFELLSLSDAALDGGEVDAERRRAAVAQLVASNGTLSLRRNKESVWNFQEIGPAQQPAPEKTPVRKEGKGGAEQPWAISVGRIATKGLQVGVEDQTTPQPARLAVSRLSLDATGLSTAKGKQGSLALSFLLNRTGKIAVQGPLSLAPLATRLQVSVRDTELAPFQPYFAQQLRALITSGAAGAEGVLSLEAPEGKPFNVAFRGGAQLTEFSCIDKTTDEDLLRFGALGFHDVDFRTSPRQLRIQGVSVTDFRTAATLGPDGSLNLSEAFAPRPAATPPPSAPVARPVRSARSAPVIPEAAPLSIEVQTITLQGGRVTFRDRQVTPAYATNLSDLGGRVSGLSSEQARLAEVDLRGKMDGYAPLAITGRIQPLARELFVDLKAAFQGADLTPATPYAGKYAGYAIDKGKLSFDVSYKIQGRKLESQNVVVLDQFTFGDRIESPTATKLPVRFAIALLKDRKGEIRLDLPVNGSLDDPQFSVGRIVWKMIVNLLTKAVTSPFALIGSLFGGQEDLGYVEFEPGSSALAEPGLRKVGALAKALKERPGLRLEIAGGSDGERDRVPLQRVFLERKLKARKAEELAAEGVEPGPLEGLTMAPEERAAYVTRVYRAEKFPKPVTARGTEKELPAEEMEKLLLTHTQITEEDLQGLAEERAAAVRDALLRSEGVETQRIFTARRTPSANERGAGNPCRVDFRLTE